MRQLFKRSWSLIAALIFMFVVIAVQAQAGEQGDKYWSGTDVSEVIATTSGTSVVFTGFPRDSNAQVVVKYVDVTAANAADNLDVYQGKASTMTTLAAAYNYTNSATLTGADTSGFTAADYFVVDDGAGNLFWSQVATSSGTTIAADAALYGGESGVTFAIGSRVYEMEKACELKVGSASVAKSNADAVFATGTGLPALFVIEATTTGAYINGITVTYE